MDELKVRNKGIHTIVALSGEIDLYSIVKLKHKLFDVITDDVNSLVIDMTELSYIDSSGIALMTDLRNKMREKEGKLSILNMNSRIQTAVKRAALENLFNIYESEDQLDS